MLKKESFKSLSIRVLAVVIFGLASFYACQQKEVKKLRNGYEYQMLQSKGGTTPRPEQVVTLDLELIDEFGNVLDDSRTADIRPAITIPGQRTLQTDRNPLLALIELMGVGDSAKVIVPIDSLPNPPQEFLQSDFIDYRIKILSIEDAKAYQKRMAAETQSRNITDEAEQRERLAEAKNAVEAYKQGTLPGRKIELGGGLIVHLINDTKGEKGEDGERVDVNYFGFLKDGTSFDNSYRTGRPYSLTIGRGGSIDGWLKGIPEVPEGSTAILDIPPSMGYGERGNPPVIPPNADLLFYIKVEKVFKIK
jgi:FKBP-type peptidyl-prolyl cis-trans isomerase